MNTVNQNQEKTSVTPLQFKIGASMADFNTKQRERPF